MGPSRPPRRSPSSERAARDNARVNAMKVLDLLQRSARPVSLLEIARACALSKQTVDRILVDLGDYYPIVEDDDPHHRQRKLYRLARPREEPPPTAAPGEPVDVELRVELPAASAFRQRRRLHGEVVLPLPEGALCVRGRASDQRALFELVLAHAPHVRIVRPLEWSEALRRFVAPIFRDGDPS